MKGELKKEIEENPKIVTDSKSIKLMLEEERRKETQEDFKKVIDKVFTSDRRRSYCKEYCQKYLIEDLEELKKEVGINDK